MKRTFFHEGDRVRFSPVPGVARDWYVIGVRENTIDGPQHLMLHLAGGGKFDSYPYWVSSSLVRLVSRRGASHVNRTA